MVHESSSAGSANLKKMQNEIRFFAETRSARTFVFSSIRAEITVKSSALRISVVLGLNVRPRLKKIKLLDTSILPSFNAPKLGLNERSLLAV